MLLGAVDLGGTHVTAGLVPAGAGVAVCTVRAELDAAAPAPTVLAVVAATMRQLDGPDVLGWTCAVPGPFDCDTGVAQYAGVGKFDALHGVDVRAHLADALGRCPSEITFVNDAEAFLLGEWFHSAGDGRWIGITLGTGVGSAFLADGEIVREGPGVPPDGSVHHLLIDGRPLEDHVSRRALLRDYVGGPDVDVIDLAARAGAGDLRAGQVLADAFSTLGHALAPWVTAFAANRLVVGGSIARAWDLVETGLRVGLPSGLTVVPSALGQHAALVGAATYATRRNSLFGDRRDTGS